MDGTDYLPAERTEVRSCQRKQRMRAARCQVMHIAHLNRPLQRHLCCGRTLMITTATRRGKPGVWQLCGQATAGTNLFTYWFPIFQEQLKLVTLFILVLFMRDRLSVKEHRTRDRKVASSNPGRSGGRIFFSRVNFVCWILFSVSSTPVLR